MVCPVKKSYLCILIVINIQMMRKHYCIWLWEDRGVERASSVASTMWVDMGGQGGCRACSSVASAMWVGVGGQGVGCVAHWPARSRWSWEDRSVGRVAQWPARCGWAWEDRVSGVWLIGQHEVGGHGRTGVSGVRAQWPARCGWTLEDRGVRCASSVAITMWVKSKSEPGPRVSTTP